MSDDTIVDFRAIKDTKEYVEKTNARIFELENALYEILDSKNIDEAKLLAADILGEDLETYLEEDEVQELDLENHINWDDITHND